MAVTVLKATEQPVAREILQDRYDGLMGSCKGNIDEVLGLALIETLGRLVEGTARVDSYTEHDEAGIVDEAMHAVEAIIVSRLAEATWTR